MDVQPRVESRMAMMHQGPNMLSITPLDLQGSPLPTMEHLRARFRFIAGNRITFLKRAAAYYKGAKRHPAASQPLLSKICTNEVVPIAAGSPEFVRVPERRDPVQRKWTKDEMLFFLKAAKHQYALLDTPVVKGYKWAADVILAVAMFWFVIGASLDSTVKWTEPQIVDLLHRALKGGFFPSHTMEYGGQVAQDVAEPIHQAIKLGGFGVTI